jgi:hypothetical protein
VGGGRHIDMLPTAACAWQCLGTQCGWTFTAAATTHTHTHTHTKAPATTPGSSVISNDLTSVCNHRTHSRCQQRVHVTLHSPAPGQRHGCWDLRNCTEPRAPSHCSSKGTHCHCTGWPAACGVGHTAIATADQRRARAQPSACTLSAAAA